MHACTNHSVQQIIHYCYENSCCMMPGATRPQLLPRNWLDPAREWVIGFSFQLAINQHQFALHALGYCHLCKDSFEMSAVVSNICISAFTLLEH